MWLASFTYHDVFKAYLWCQHILVLHSFYSWIIFNCMVVHFLSSHELIEICVVSIFWLFEPSFIGLCVDMFLFLLGISRSRIARKFLLSKWLYYFTFPIVMCEVSNSSQPCQYLFSVFSVITILMDMKLYVIGRFWFTFPWWFMIFTIFSCACNCISSLKKCLFSSLLFYKFWLFVLL